MKSRESTSPRLLFLFPRPGNGMISEVESGEVPSERLYGVCELLRRGWDVTIDDNRYQGLAGWLNRKLRPFGVKTIGVRTLSAIWRNDIVVVKDEFSLAVSMAAKLLGRKLVYYDAMFQIPARRWRRWLTRASLVLADAVISYSPAQSRLWAEEFKVERDKFRDVRYTIDVDFYRPTEGGRAGDGRPYVLSVGRDMGRDFATLAQALEGTGIGLRIVSLPSLTRAISARFPWVEVYERLSYKDLFDLYAGALLVAVPIKKGTYYPSGIRGVLESMALGRATVCTRTDILEESFSDGREIVFVQPGDVEELREKIQGLAGDESRRRKIEEDGCGSARVEFSMERLIEPLEALFHALKRG